MFIIKPNFSTRYPFILFRKPKSEIQYREFSMGGHKLSVEQQLMTTVNKSLLLENQVPINKIRFVYKPIFTYDVDNNVINPEYKIMLPVDVANGKFVDGAVIELGKPEKLINISVSSYKTDDNYLFLKSLSKSSKRGIVIFIADEMFMNIDGTKSPYKFKVDDEVIRIANLDTEVDAFLHQQI